MKRLPTLYNTIQRKRRTYRSWPLADQCTMPLIFILLGLMRATILCLPYRWYAAILGEYRQTDIFTPILTPEQIQRARRTGRLVRATAGITPWQSLCFVQALTATILLRLRRLPYIMHFGLAKSQQPEAINPLQAHAWVTAGPIAVTGGCSLPQFTVVGTYCESNDW
jgi:hypothetical protein